MTRALPYNESLIIGLGWFYDLHIAGGWTHMDVRDDEGRRIPFNTRLKSFATSTSRASDIVIGDLRRMSTI